MDKLKSIFNRLDLIVEEEAAIRFTDAETLRLLTTEKAYIDYVSNANIGTLQYVDRDGDGMITQEELKSIKSLSNRPDNNSSIFANNNILEVFNEFRYFTGLNMINNGCFNNCSSLKEVTLPVLTKMGNSVFQSSGIEKLLIPEGYQIIGDSILQRCPNLVLVDFPSTVTSISAGGSLFWSMKNQAIVVCRALIPPAFGGWGYDGDPKAIYVPDITVDAYKSASGWSLQSAKIKPISEMS